MKRLQLLAMVLVLVAAPAGAASDEPTLVTRPGGGPALVIPRDSPVRFDGFDENGAARFQGRFELAGMFVYDCPTGCEPGMTEADVELTIRPVRELARRLPHWQDRGDELTVDIGAAPELRRKLVDDTQMERVLAGEMSVQGNGSIVVDGFTADFGCDYSPYYSVRFVALEKAPALVEAKGRGWPAVLRPQH